MPNANAPGARRWGKLRGNKTVQARVAKLKATAAQKHLSLN
jgi:hypothetical protein